MPLITNNSTNGENNLFSHSTSSVSGQFLHFEYFVLSKGRVISSRGFFRFGFLPDSGAKDLRLIGVHEHELKDAAGETRAKETVPVAKKRRSTNGAIRVGGIAGMFPGVDRFNFFYSVLS